MKKLDVALLYEAIAKLNLWKKILKEDPSKEEEIQQKVEKLENELHKYK